MPNIYKKSKNILKIKKKNSGLEESSLDFILKYSSSIEVLKSKSNTLILLTN